MPLISNVWIPGLEAADPEVGQGLAQHAKIIPFPTSPEGRVSEEFLTLCWDYNNKILYIKDNESDGPYGWIPLSQGIVTSGVSRISGSGSPEGAIPAVSGSTYWDYTNKIFYTLDIAPGTVASTGWREIIA